MYFTGKVNVAVAVGVVLATLLVAIIIVMVGCWVRKLKSKKGGISHYLQVTITGVFRHFLFSYVVKLNNRIPFCK